MSRADSTPTTSLLSSTTIKWWSSFSHISSAASARLASKRTDLAELLARSSFSPRSQPPTVVVVPRRCSEKARRASAAVRTPSTRALGNGWVGGSRASPSISSSLTSPCTSSSSSRISTQFCLELYISSKALSSESLTLQVATRWRCFIPCSAVSRAASLAECSPTWLSMTLPRAVSTMPRAMSSADKIRTRPGPPSLACTSR
mmetsp:Transcript_62718/g.149723  ORF Transcript_62718/g.149723 Transcript_62718/m.149723 type:complete len:203 (-) Transcript_62718:1668-2276(-)